MEEVECARCDVCAYKERDLSALKSVLVDEGKVRPVSGSWTVVVSCEVEEAKCTALLQLFWAAEPVKRSPKKQKGNVSQELSSDGGRERNAGPRVGPCGHCWSNETRTGYVSTNGCGGRTRLEEPKGRRHREGTECRPVLAKRVSGRDGSKCANF